jgi:hypothetical protein
MLSGGIKSCGDFCNQYIPYVFIGKECRGNCKVLSVSHPKIINERLLGSISNRSLHIINSNEIFIREQNRFLRICSDLKRQANTSPNLFIFNKIIDPELISILQDNFVLVEHKIDDFNYVCAFHA